MGSCWKQLNEDERGHSLLIGVGGGGRRVKGQQRASVWKGEQLEKDTKSCFNTPTQQQTKKTTNKNQKTIKGQKTT